MSVVLIIPAFMIFVKIIAHLLLTKEERKTPKAPNTTMGL